MHYQADEELFQPGPENPPFPRRKELNQMNLARLPCAARARGCELTVAIELMQLFLDGGEPCLALADHEHNGTGHAARVLVPRFANPVPTFRTLNH